MIQLTDWFPEDVKPVRKGVYERDYRHSGMEFQFCLWNGKCWGEGCRTVRLAEQSRLASLWPDLPWRGLAEKPE